jgi:multiple sugar transport system permease protein
MQWLSNPQFAMPGVILATVWKQTPYMIIMILAGLQSANPDLLDAAAIDGASWFKTFINVVLPSIAVVLSTTVIISVLDAFQQFTIIFNMTAGGPLRRTTTLSIAAYKEAFTLYDLGAGSAIGVIWMMILMTITIIFNVKSQRLED